MNIGTRIGAFEILAKLGEGGMGEVYRARDTRLDRDVAIKILPAAFTADADRLARFQREAKVLASLNHPNIGGIHGLEEHEGVIALVLELVEGPTLADILAGPGLSALGSGHERHAKRSVSEATEPKAQSPKPRAGGLPLDEALPIARQIAEALEAAHEQGIIHRDLKPANIKVRPDGTVKVLDFGLAKALEAQGSGLTAHDATQSPTITSPAMTQAGVILGTAAYMSPEQAKGRPLDKRTDVWSFGAVLYEMLAGQRPFKGEDIADTMAAVLRQDVDWSALPAATPMSVRRLLERCLNRDAKHRLRDIGEARIVLADPIAPGTVETRAIAAAARPAWQRAAALAMGALIVGSAAAAAVWFSMQPLPARVVRTTIGTSGTAALEQQGSDTDVSITPDGTQIVYRANNRLVVRALDTLEPRVLEGLGTPRGPFISPDGEWIGFFDGSAMKKVSIRGGLTAPIATIGDNNPRGATWGPDGRIIFATGTIATGLQRVDAAGGTPEVLTTPSRERELDHLWPELLPGGHAVLYTVVSLTRSIETSQIAVLDLQTGMSKVLIKGGSHARYLPSGHLVYGVTGTLSSVPFDLDNLVLTGTPTPVLEGVVTTSIGAADIAVAANGTLVYVPGRVDGGGQQTVVSMDREGRASALPNLPVDSYRDVRVSPDGKQLALATQNDIFIYDIEREIATRLTTDPAQDIAPLWTRDGKRVVFTSRRAGYSEIFWRQADGTDAEKLLLTRDRNLIDLNANDWSSDGTHLLITEVSSNGQVVGSIQQLTLARPNELQPLLKNDFNHGRARISPDGRWMAYESNRSGRQEVYVERYPTMGERQPISTNGGRLPLWGPDGQELFFVAPDGRQMFVVPVQLGSTFVAGRPRVLFETGMTPILGGSRPADITPDGRFMIVRSAATEAGGPTSSLVVVQNWFEELKRLVPVP